MLSKYLMSNLKKLPIAENKNNFRTVLGNAALTCRPVFIFFLYTWFRVSHKAYLLKLYECPNTFFSFCFSLWLSTLFLGLLDTSLYDFVQLQKFNYIREKQTSSRESGWARRPGPGVWGEGGGGGWGFRTHSRSKYTDASAEAATLEIRNLQSGNFSFSRLKARSLQDKTIRFLTYVYHYFILRVGLDFKLLRCFLAAYQSPMKV